MQLSSVRLGHLVGALGILGLGAVLLFWAPWSAQARADPGQRSSNVLVNCEPSQQTLVRQTIVNNELNVAIQCVTSSQAQAVGYVDQFGRPILPVGGGVARPIPAVYAPAPTLVSTPAAPRTRVVSRSSESRRSWQKRALVLGGSAGAGAGIGGLIGGKKGALIGAALGGGGAALYEATKDR